MNRFKVIAINEEILTNALSSEIREKQIIKWSTGCTAPNEAVELVGLDATASPLGSGHTSCIESQV
jgi:hypothetical protein